MTPWLSLPESDRSRLIRNEAAQRRETAKRGLPAKPCAPEALWMLQRGMCSCGECRGEVALDPSTAVIAHIFFRGGVGSPGHVPHNVAIWNQRCNQREAGPETAAMWKGRRMEAKKAEPADEPQPAKATGKHKQIASAGFSKTLRRKMNGTIERVSK
jgi:hypothetical protein